MASNIGTTAKANLGDNKHIKSTNVFFIPEILAQSRQVWRPDQFAAKFADTFSLALIDLGPWSRWRRRESDIKLRKAVEDAVSKYVIDDGWRFPFYEIFYMALGGAIVGLCVLAWNIPEVELPKFERAQSEESAETRAEEPADLNFAERTNNDGNYKSMLIDPEQLEKLADPTPTFSKEGPEPVVIAKPIEDEPEEMLEPEPVKVVKKSEPKPEPIPEHLPSPRIFHWAYFDGGYNSIYPYEGVTVKPKVRKQVVQIEKVAIVEKPEPKPEKAVEPTPEKPKVNLAPPTIQKVVIEMASEPPIEAKSVEVDEPLKVKVESPPKPKSEPKAIPVATRTVASSNPNSVEPVEANVGEDFYTIRVGVFVQDESVAKLVKELKGHGYDAFKKKKFRGGAMRTYVYVGNFKKREEAEAFHSGFAHKTGLKSIVTYHTRFNES